MGNVKNGSSDCGASDEDCEGQLWSMPAKKMKAEARKITIVMVDASTEVCDIGAESDRHSCVAWL